MSARPTTPPAPLPPTAPAPLAAAPPAPLAATVVPFPVTAPHRVTPAPRPVDGPPTVEVDDAWPAAADRRLARLAADPDGVLVRDPVDRDDAGVLAALREAWSLLPRLDHLGVSVDRERGTVERTGPSLHEAATAALLGRTGADLLVVGWLLACSDDLVVLRRSGTGELRAELLAVAFPSGWPPRRRAGASLRELHAPVADGERLQKAAPALTEALLQKGPLRLHVWGLDPDGRLDHDPSDPTAAPVVRPSGPAGWWLRVERQTSVPLPGLHRALFTIRPYLVPLPALVPAQRHGLAEALSSMTPETLRYKGVADVADELCAWLRAS